MHGQDFLGGPSVCEALSRSHAVEKEDVDRIYRTKRINLRTRKQTPNGEPLFLISFRFPSCKSRKSCQNPSSLTASFRLRLTGSIANRINREIREIRETEPCQVSFRLVRVFRVFRGKKSSWLRRGFGSAPQDWQHARARLFGRAERLRGCK